MPALATARTLTFRTSYVDTLAQENMTLGEKKSLIPPATEGEVLELKQVTQIPASSKHPQSPLPPSPVVVLQQPSTFQEILCYSATNSSYA